VHDLSLNFNIVLPKLEVLGYFGSRNNIVLPALQATMELSIDNTMRFAVRLPKLEVEWAGSVGLVWNFRITLPLLQTSGRFGGWRFTALLPALEGAAGGAMGIGLGSKAWTFDIQLPRLKASAQFTTAPAGYRFFVVLPALAMVHGLAGDVLLPALRVSARFSTPLLPGQSVTYRGWAMNLQNMAVTEFDGFEFRAMAFAYNHHYGVGMDGGLYRMGGDRDDGRPIKWAWESGLGDFGSPAQKGVLALYVDGLFANTATFLLVTDDARRVYGHRAKGNVYNHQPHRVPLGKAVRTRNIGLGMADEEGGYLELDKITPEYVITSRNI
jgi:hypothetical protein